jgi:Tfp pilus assembly protein PilE
MPRNNLGVTLIEIMLVLTVAALIIVTSIRLYQTATVFSQLNQVSAQIVAIVGAAQQVAQPSGSFIKGLGADAKATLAPRLFGNAFTTPWGTTIDVEATSTTFSVKVSGVPASLCPRLSERLMLNKRFKVTEGTCDEKTPSDMTYTYSVVVY